MIKKMKARINGIDVEGTVSEVLEFKDKLDQKYFGNIKDMLKPIPCDRIYYAPEHYLTKITFQN